VHLGFTPEQKELRAEIRASLEAVMTPERVAAVAGRIEGADARSTDGGSDEVKECVRALGAAGLLGVGWPKEYGGRGFTALEQFIFFEEAQRVNAPIPLVTLNTVGPTLAHCGTEEQKRTFLPAILDGTVEFAIGYSEPSAGNEGWRLITTQLNFERAALGNMGALEPLFEKTLRWAQTTELDGGHVIDQPWVQQALARVEAQVAAYKIMNLRVNAAMTKGALGMGEASAVKVFGTELTQQVTRQLLDVLDRGGTRKGDDAPLRGALESAYRIAVINTFGGGGNELQRDIIAMAGLFMPRAPRDLRASATQNGDTK
jgi:alkylation response protein AidB-like acyl-CoA dehydrogenase